MTGWYPWKHLDRTPIWYPRTRTWDGMGQDPMMGWAPWTTGRPGWDPQDGTLVGTGPLERDGTGRLRWGPWDGTGPPR